MLETSYYVIMKEMTPLCGASEEINVCRIPYKPVILDKSKKRCDAFLAPEECVLTWVFESCPATFSLTFPLSLDQY
jgi:hypothetical protein